MGGAGIKRGEMPQTEEERGGICGEFLGSRGERGHRGGGAPAAGGAGPAHGSGRITLAAGGLPPGSGAEEAAAHWVPDGASARRSGGLLSGLDPAAAVSYGTGPRDTLTLSSREERQLWCAIQRELVTVEGRVVERQELPLRLPDHMSPLSVLAAAGALLLLGVPPEELGRDRGAVRGSQG